MRDGEGPPERPCGHALLIGASRYRISTVAVPIVSLWPQMVLISAWASPERAVQPVRRFDFARLQRRKANSRDFSLSGVGDAHPEIGFCPGVRGGSLHGRRDSLSREALRSPGLTVAPGTHGGTGGPAGIAAWAMPFRVNGTS
jgi:hypothetical protein